MEIEYNRDIKCSSMLLTCRCRLEETEEFMLTKNQIYGLIPVTFRKEDDNMVFLYDITGKQSLEAVLEGDAADERMLLSLFSGITGLLERLDKYLLCGTNLLLLPESIFRDYRTEEFCFCYCSGNGQELPEAFRKLVEYLLAKTNHKDERAVDIIYSVYEETLKEGYSLKHIREKLCLWQRGASDAADESEEEIIVQREKGERKPYSEPEFIAAGEEGGKHETFIDTAERRIYLESVKRYLRVDFWKSRIKSFFTGRIKGTVIKPGKKRKATEPIVFEPEEEAVKVSRPTVLLAERKAEPAGILKYEGTNRQSDFQMDHFPYLIGSDFSCDGVISWDTVSRKHAKISKSENIYFIEDLNSLNGTIVGGQLLQYKRRVSLEINEVIEFGGERYRFF